MRVFIIIILTMLFGQTLGAEGVYMAAGDTEAADPCLFNVTETTTVNSESENVGNRGDWPSMPSGYL